MHTWAMPNPLRILTVVLLVFLAAPAALAQSQPRVDVTFSVMQTTTVGQSVFVLGDAPELGGNVMTRAVKLAPTSYPLWRATISLPAGSTYTYRYVIRSDGPGQTSLATNGTFVSAPITATAPAAAQPSIIPSKVLILTWGDFAPAMFYRPVGSAAAFTRINMRDLGPSPRPGDRQWLAWDFLPAGARYEFYFTAADGVSVRYPSTGSYTTSLDGLYVQDGQQYTYLPASTVTPARRDYNPASVPTIFSPQLNASRGYRVYVPRGYVEHPTRRYPVLYMHDGQNVFESGAFGSWNAAGTITSLQANGLMRETIIVALDNGPSRLTDYLPPTDFLTGTGQGDKYLSYIRDTVKPIIDTQYRTLPGADTTGLLGSSMGGVISLYGVWDFTSTFTRGGLMSGAWQTCNNYLNRVRATPPRSIKMFIDSGDSGASNDNYWLSYNLRDYFADQASPKYALEGTLRHVIGYGQQHNEAAWSQRLPDALTFLYPAGEERNLILAQTFGSQWDVQRDGTIDTNDAYAQSASPRDLNLDGTIADSDLLPLEQHLRKNEAASMRR